MLGVMDFLGHAIDRFMRRAAAQGAHIESGRCQPDQLPPITALPTPVYTTGCGGQTRISFPYEREDGDFGSVTVCAVDDSAYRFPRFMDNPNAGPVALT